MVRAEVSTISYTNSSLTLNKITKHIAQKFYLDFSVHYILATKIVTNVSIFLKRFFVKLMEHFNRNKVLEQFLYQFSLDLLNHALCF